MIKYFEDFDKEFPELKYEVLGDESSEEVVVKLFDSKNDIFLEMRRKSSTLYPKMCDRIFGIETSDMIVSYELSDLLFAEWKRLTKHER